MSARLHLMNTYDEALALAREGRVTEARELFDQVANQNEALRPKATYFAGRCHLAAGELQAAARAFEAVARECAEDSAPHSTASAWREALAVSALLALIAARIDLRQMDRADEALARLEALESAQRRPIPSGTKTFADVGRMLIRHAEQPELLAASAAFGTTF